MKLNKYLAIYSFVLYLILLIFSALKSTDLSQILISFIYLPVFLYFSTKLFNKKKNRPKIAAIPARPTVKPETSIQEYEGLPKDVSDKNKRLFLRLIGTSGLAMLLMALFTKNAQASFFGSAPVGPSNVGIKDSSGTRIDPAEKAPTDGYEITELDDSGSTVYYGFVKKDGSWYILQDTSGAFRYYKGTSNFTTYWTNRTSITYDYYNNVFS